MADNDTREAGLSPRLLVADDQEDVLTALALLLKGEGFAVDLVQSPAVVLRALTTHRYDLLLLDMNYTLDTTSGTEGLDLLDEIRRHDKQLPVVLMTAWSNVDLAVEAMRGGGADFIQKPWNNQVLLKTIRQNLEADRQERPSGQLAAMAGREAHEIQRGLFPDALPSPEACEIHGSWHPVADVGGDYYDAIALDDSSIAVCIADVCGKGIPAALLMANVQAGVRTLAHTSKSPSEICRQINHLIFNNTPSDKFITFFYGVVDMSRGTLRYSNAGHLPPFLTRPDGDIRRLSVGGSVLGVIRGASYEEAETRFAGGDRLVLCTDGVTEAQNPAGEEFGDRRLRDLIRLYLSSSLAHFHDSLLREVRAFAGNLQDDAAVLSVSCTATL